jgi:hypothetical protein
MDMLHLNGAPNEATTSIWLKAMMVRSDLRGNSEPMKNESGMEVERWEPDGCARGRVGVDSARRAIFYRSKVATEFAFEVGDTAGGYGIAMRIPLRIPLTQGVQCPIVCAISSATIATDRQRCSIGLRRAARAAKCFQKKRKLKN